MAETKGEQYLTELLFDVSKIPNQFKEINKLLVSEGTTLKQLMEQNWDIGVYLKKQADIAERAVAESTKKMQTSWHNAYQILRSTGDPFADVAQMLKSGGKRLAVVWTDEMEKEFRTRMPELKKQLSEWIRWVGEGQGMHFDGRLSNDLITKVPQLGENLNQMDMLEKLNRGLQQYKATARQIVETGSMFSNEIEESERLRAAYDMLTGKAQEFYRIRKDGFTAQEAGSASYNETYAYLQRCAAEATALSATEAKIKVQLNENGEIRKAAITYTDQQNRSVQVLYGWYEKLNLLTGETQRAFGQIGSTVIDDKLARAATSAKELEQNAKQFQAAYEQTSKSLAQSYLYMQKNGFSEEQVSIVKRLAQQTYQLEACHTDITKDVLAQMKALQEQAATTAKIIQQDKDKKALAAAEKAEREKVLSINREIAAVQKQIRTGGLNSTKLSGEANILRQQSDELVRQLEASGKLTSQQRERLKVLDQQLSAIRTQSATMTADQASGMTAQQEVAAMAARWFSAYRIWYRAIYFGKKTVSTMKDVEMSVTEVSRVINDASFQFGEFTGDVFHLAENYGRSFEDTIDISTRFAQAGYNVRETLSMTRDSLLALNTAELDAKNATQSIIGIMQQWQLEPEKMIGVIDRINKVADNYAITSQDLVDGLLKSSSMAKQANLSFEQTVGILTAMKTASGAAGKEVGNAFKSILAFIQRPDSIKGFEEMGIKMIADEATGTLRPMMDILEDMAEKWNGSSQAAQTSMMGILDKAGMFSKEMAIAVGAEDEFTAAQNEFAAASDKANDAETRQQANLAAGVYRRNYYTALMENFSRVYDIVIEQQNADGYSMQENSKYMATLQAKYTTLITSLKELAVVSGQNGLMDIAKGAVETATALAKFSTNAGGIAPVMTSLLGLFVALKREKLARYIDGIVTSIASLKNIFPSAATAAGGTAAALNSVGSAASSATTAANGAAAAVSGVASAASAALGVFGLLTTAVSMAVMAANNHAQAAEQQRQELYEAAEAAKKETENVNDLVKEYHSLGRSHELDEVGRARLTGIQEQMIRLLGMEANALDLVNGKYEDNIRIIDEASRAKLEDAQRAAQAALNEARAEAKKPLPELDTMSAASAMLDKNSEAMKILAGQTEIENFSASITQDATIRTFGEAEERAAALREALDLLADSGQRTSQEYTALNMLLQEYSKIAETCLEAERDLDEITAELQVKDALRNETLPKTCEEYKRLRESLIEAGEASGNYEGRQEEIASAIDKALGKIPEFSEYIKASSEAASEAQGGVEGAARAVEQWAEKLAAVDTGDLESQIEMLSEAIEKLTNKTYLSKEEAMRLVAAFPELAEKTRWCGEGYYFVQGALEEVLGAQQNLRAEVELSGVATEYLKGATDDQKLALADAVRELESAGDETERFTALTKTAISVMAGFQSGIGNFVGKIASTISQGLAAVKDLLSGAGSNLKIDGYTSKTDYSGGRDGKSAAEKAAEEARKQAKKKADDYIKRLQKASKEKQKGYDDEIKALRKTSEAEQKDYEKRIKHLQKLKEESKKYYDEQIKQVKKKYDDEIEALKKVEEERSRARERADIEEEISYWKKRSGVEAVEKIAELEKELSRKEEDWSTDDQIKQLEELRDAEVERLEETRDAMSERYDAEIENLQEQKEAAKEAADARIEQLQEEKEAEKEKYDNWIEYLREISSDSDSTADQILQAIENVKNGAVSGAEQIGWTLDSLAQTAVRTINEAIDEIKNGGSGGKTPANTGRYIHTTANAGQIPKSHTGSEIRSGGLVEVAPAEIIVNPEISRGLRRIVEREKQIQNFYNQRYSDSHGKIVQINSPLYNIEKQEIADRGDLQLEKNDVARALDKALASLT